MATSRRIAPADYGEQNERCERYGERLIGEPCIAEKIWVSHIEQRGDPCYERRTADVFVEQVESQHKQQSCHSKHDLPRDKKRESCQTAQGVCENLQSGIK